MGAEGEQLNYIQKPFKGCCPFCLSGNPNWSQHKGIFKKIKYRCNACGAEITVKLQDVVTGNYDSAKILIDNTGKYGQIYRRSECCWISFHEFYEKSIISHHYQKIGPISRNQDYIQSCRICKYGVIQSGDEAIRCNKFEFVGEADRVCDSFVDETVELIEALNGE